MSSRVFAYIRTSTVKQGTEGVSLEAQHDAIAAYAQRHDLEVIKWFSETQTAAKQGRPIFARMMKELKRGRVSGLILHRIDRGSRNLRDWSDIADLSDLGLHVHFAHDALDLQTRGGRLAADVQAVVAADFIRNLREETLKGMRGRLKQGLWPWAAPPGYVDQGKAAAKTIDPILGPSIRRAFELYATGTYSYEMLRDAVFPQGLRSDGRPLSMHGVASLLTNPFYYGVMRVESWDELHPGIHKPLINKSLFDRVQDVIHGRAPKRAFKRSHRFRRSIRCSTCSYMLIGETQKGFVYYRCHSLSCRGTSIREEKVVEIQAQALQRLGEFVRTHPELAGALRARIEKIRRERKDAVRNANAVRAKLQDRLSALADAVIDGIIDRETYTTKRNVLIQEDAAMREHIGRLSDGEAPKARMAYTYLELLAALKYKPISDNEGAARSFLANATSNFVVSRKVIDIQWLDRWREVIEDGSHPLGDPGSCTARTLDEWVELFMGKEPDQV